MQAANAPTPGTTRPSASSAASASAVTSTLARRRAPAPAAPTQVARAVVETTTADGVGSRSQHALGATARRCARGSGATAVAQRPGHRLELGLDDVVRVAAREHAHVQADAARWRPATRRCAGSAWCRRCRSAGPCRRAPCAPGTGGRTGRPPPGPASRPSAPARRRSGGCRPCRRAPRAAPGRARCAVSSTVWWASISRSPLARTVRSKQPCLPSWASMWSKNGTPVATSVIAGAVEVELDQRPWSPW